MLHKPDDLKLFDTSKFITASDGEKATQIFTSKADALIDVANNRSAFYDFYDDAGQLLTSFKLKDEEDGLDGVYLDDSF